MEHQGQDMPPRLAVILAAQENISSLDRFFMRKDQMAQSWSGRAHHVCAYCQHRSLSRFGACQAAYEQTSVYGILSFLRIGPFLCEPLLSAFRISQGASQAESRSAFAGRLIGCGHCVVLPFSSSRWFRMVCFLAPKLQLRDDRRRGPKAPRRPGKCSDASMRYS